MPFISLILFRYIARRFLLWLVGLLALLVAVIILAETIELLRRAAGREDMGFGLVVRMALLKTPAGGRRGPGGVGPARGRLRPGRRFDGRAI